jgi:uncharacterized protein YkwD
VVQLINERRATVRLGIILAVVLTLGFMVPKHADATTSPERAMASLINRARTSHGRSSLRVNDGLSNYARRHSATMASKGVLYHNPYLAKWLASWSWSILGENVGVGSSIDSLHRAFMNSPPHRANIMDRRFRDVGVGVVVRGGRTWVTIIFRG